MKMNPLISLALALILALLPLAAPAETETSVTLQGLITEAGSTYFIMTDRTHASVQVNIIDGVTVFEGIAAKDTLAVGLYVFVTYDGVMSRSLPPQVSAQIVACYRLTGTVADILENGVIVTGDEVTGTAIVLIGDNFPPVYLGVPITVYYNGLMALSMPPQIFASHIIVPYLEGAVSDANAQTFILTDADGATHIITMDAHTVTYAAPMDGEQVRVYVDGAAAENGTVYALEIVSTSEQESL